MLGFKLRDEFLGAHMPGTAIALRTSDNRGGGSKITGPHSVHHVSDSRCPDGIEGDQH